jgi:putative transposase
MNIQSDKISEPPGCYQHRMAALTTTVVEKRSIASLKPIHAHAAPQAKVLRSYKFRLFANVNQQRELSRSLESHRRLYNRALDGRLLCWETAGLNWSFAEQSRWLTIQRRSNEHLAAIGSDSAIQTLRRLDKTYAAFFRCGGRPRFKDRDAFHSFVFRAKNGFWILPSGKLRLFGIGDVRVRWHRQIPSEARIKQVTVKREGDKWFAVFSCEIPAITNTKASSSSIGIDVGLKSFVTTSDGETMGDSRSLERTLPELRRRQRALSRCKRGSNRRQQVKSRVTKLYVKVRNSRRDMHHKVAHSLVNRYGVIAAESLSVANMLRNRRLARRISDAGWGQFIGILQSKAESAGSKVILVDPKNTSQECSACGEIVRKSLAVRVHVCNCGCVLDRDHNAALNVLARAAPDGHNAEGIWRGRKSQSQLLLAMEWSLTPHPTITTKPTMTKPDSVAAAAERYRRWRAGENCYVIYMPEMYTHDLHLKEQFTERHELEFRLRRDADTSLLAVAYLDATEATTAARPAWEGEARKIFDAGFAACRGYGDNHFHYRGEQADRVFAKAMERLGIPLTLPAASEPVEPWSHIPQAGEWVWLDSADGITRGPFYCKAIHSNGVWWEGGGAHLGGGNRFALAAVSPPPAVEVGR